MCYIAAVDGLQGGCPEGTDLGIPQLPQGHRSNWQCEHAVKGEEGKASVDPNSCHVGAHRAGGSDVGLGYLLGPWGAVQKLINSLTLNNRSGPCWTDEAVPDSRC